jgi:putative transposase
MHLRGQVLAGGENYHIFNRGANKQAIFTSDDDYQRFVLLLYLYNTHQHVVMRDVISKYSAKRFKGQGFIETFKHEYSDKSLVDILAYSLMPNHFHLVLRPKDDTGVQHFLQKVCVAYSMYFNTKYGHSGTLFQGRYKAKHLDTEPYFRYIFAYVHLNPLDLIQSDWKKAGIRCAKKARTFLTEYRYSSLQDHLGTRPESAILSDERPDFLTDQNDLDDLMKWEYLPVLDDETIDSKDAKPTKIRSL